MSPTDAARGGPRDDVATADGSRDVAVHPDDPPLKAPPWDPAPRWAPHATLRTLTLDGLPLAEYVDGSGAPGFDAPRPHLHPVRTPAGIVVTASTPRDHTWHVGLGIGVQDVAGHNLWGGRTYLRDAGYTWRRDHGRIRHDGWLAPPTGTGPDRGAMAAANGEAGADGAPVADGASVANGASALVQALSWLGADGEVLLTEVRELRWAWAAPGRPAAPPAAWRLDVRSTLTVPSGAGAVRLGSPGAHGRAGGGYGGLFWRLPACRDVDVRTPTGRGEEAVHGSVPSEGAAWLAWTAVALDPGRTDSPDRVAAEPSAAASGLFTVAIAPADGPTSDDPWFVRASGYPGIGSALAWSRPLLVEAATTPVRRAWRCLVADGRVPDDVVDTLLGESASLDSRVPPENRP